jgi:hypothetical protein
VLIADAASFYEYIEHDRLAYELVGTTGDSDATESLMGLLGGTMSGPKGLPQGPAASPPLADIYISPVARALSRSGYRFSRYTDDFRIVAADWGEARRAQVFLEEAMRDVGLTLAPGKLKTPKLATYRAAVKRMSETREITPNLAVGVFGGGYGGEPVYQQPVSDEEVAEAELVLGKLIAQKNIDAVSTRRMRWALARLAYGGSLAVLASLQDILRSYAHVTPSISSYIRVLLERHLQERALASVSKWFTDGSFRYPWQVGWMLHATAFSPQRSRRLAAAARQFIVSPDLPWFARGQAAIALAVHGSLPSQREYVGVYELSPEATRPDLIAAAMIGQPNWYGPFLTGVATTPMLRAVLQLNPAEYQTWLR